MCCYDSFRLPLNCSDHGTNMKLDRFFKRKGIKKQPCLSERTGLLVNKSYKNKKQQTKKTVTS